MCNYNTLKQTPHGYVVQCKRCDQIQVAYGTTVISLSRRQYYDHMAAVEEQYALYNGRTPEDRKVIHIPTAARGVAMIFTLAELRRLRHLLKDARSKLEYNDLFVINEN